MVGVTYRSASSRPANSANKFVPPQPQPEKQVERGPAPTFKDKEAYQELFKPLPKPEAIPQLVPFKVCEKWKSSTTSLTYQIILGSGQVMEATSR